MGLKGFISTTQRRADIIKISKQEQQAEGNEIILTSKEWPYVDNYRR